jgi:hypothetical protein
MEGENKMLYRCSVKRGGIIVLDAVLSFYQAMVWDDGLGPFHMIMEARG